MRQVVRWSRFAAALVLGWGAASLPMPAYAVYVLQQTIPVPATPVNPLNGDFTSYDISFFDNSAIGGFDYVADRSNAAVDVIKAAREAPRPRSSAKSFRPVPTRSPAWRDRSPQAPA